MNTKELSECLRKIDLVKEEKRTLYNVLRETDLMGDKADIVVDLISRKDSELKDLVLEYQTVSNQEVYRFINE